MCTEHQVGMYLSAGVGDVAVVLPVLESRVLSLYFLDTPRMNVSVREHGALKKQIFCCGNVYCSNTIIITIQCFVTRYVLTARSF